MASASVADLLDRTYQDGPIGEHSLRMDVGIQVDLSSQSFKGRPVKIELLPPNRRLQTLQELGRELTQAAPRILYERRTDYHSVKVLSVFWELGEYPEMEENARSMLTIFREAYNFDSELVPLSSEQGDVSLLAKLGQAMLQLSKAHEQNLLIFYYCGHGVWDSNGKTWLKPHMDATVALEWDRFQSILQLCDCDLLLLFDCCHATAMIKERMKWKRRCEIFGATNPFDEALADTDKSFTVALRSELGKFSKTGISVDRLRWLLTNKDTVKGYRMERQPDYRLHSDSERYPSSIYLQPHHELVPDSSSDTGGTLQRSLDALNAMTDAVMLFAVKLDSTTGPPRLMEWKNMIKAAPHDVSSVEASAITIDQYRALLPLAQVHGVFAGSSVLIMSLPIWFWDHLAPNPSYKEIGIIRSDNLWMAESQGSEVMLAMEKTPRRSMRPAPYATDPILSMMKDLTLFIQLAFTWPVAAGLPGIILPLVRTRSGFLDELALTIANLWAVLLNVFLFIVQNAFLISLTLLALPGIPVFFFLLYTIGFIVGNHLLTSLLNGPSKGLFQSNPACVENWGVHEHEKWVFMNGSTIGDHWLQSNLDRLAMTFRRPVFGIHNQTRGIIFDMLEGIVQRNLGFATTDVRTAYGALAEMIADHNITKVILVLHGQGCIKGGIVLDWLYATLPVEQLRKLELYTFGNAGNHWSAPTILSESTSKRGQAATTWSNDGGGNNSPEQRIVQHIEHYANEGDFVARFGILHFRPDRELLPTSTRRAGNEATTYKAQLSKIIRFIPTVIASIWTAHETLVKDSEEEEENLFYGRLFKRVGSGHLFNQHYLDHFFELEDLDMNDPSKGRVKDYQNNYMNAEVDMDVFNKWNTVQAVAVTKSQTQNVTERAGAGKKRIKDLCRLWAYRNGMSALE